MAYRTLLTVLTEQDQVGPVLSAGATLARRMDAHLEVLCLGIDMLAAAAFYPGTGMVVLEQAMMVATDQAAALDKAARKALEQEDIRWSVESGAVPIGSLANMVAERARFADLLLAVKPADGNRDIQNVIEAALFAGQCPVLLLPAPDLPQTWRTMVVGWDQSREALNAVRAALPLLRVAKLVSVAIIDPPSHGPERSDPGGALSQMLSRHGVHAEVSVLAHTLPSIADELNRHVRDKGADLIVMGAYGHSRLREWILGGATRGMMDKAEVPVFMAH